MNSNKKNLVIVTTVPSTLKHILGGQPAFLSTRYQVSLVSSAGIAEVSAKERVAGHRVNMYRGISPFRDLVSLFQMIRLFFNIKPDIVHSYTPKAGLIVALAAFICRVPVRIHTFTGLIFPTSHGIKRLILEFFDRLVVHLNTHIICEGKGVWSQLETAGFKCKKFKIIGNGNIAGIDLAHFNTFNISSDNHTADLRYNANFNPRKTTFVYVGRLNLDKGLHELAAVFENVKDKAQLIIVGKLDKTMPPSHQTLERLQQNSTVFFTGFLDDIRPVLEMSDCLILPSYREGFPNVVLQAGAMKLPCIVTDIPGSNEIITDGINGLIAPARSIEGLEIAINKFLKMDAKHIENMGSVARRNIEKYYDKNWYLKQLVSFYENT